MFQSELKTRVASLEAALHELGRKYQSLQVLNERRMTHFLFIIKKMIHVFLPSLQVENAKLQGRK